MQSQVLSGVTLSVPESCVFGFVGRNGAGKTTTMKSIIGLLQPDGGEITVCGEKVTYGGTKTNRFIGCLPDVPEFYGYMTAREYMSLCGRVAGMKPTDIQSRSDELLELVGLSGEKHRIRGYSRGMISFPMSRKTAAVGLNSRKSPTRRPPRNTSRKAVCGTAAFLPTGSPMC